jgi:sterol-4alpha-carboxylate 3-dehydrogenase (decarboxylating)
MDAPATERVALSPILVTGGCGFLGSHIVDALVAAHFVVVAVSRNPTRYCNPGARYVACDFTDSDATAHLIDNVKPKAIVHTITAGPMTLWPGQKKDYLATKNLLGLARRASFVNAFIYTSSAEGLANSSGLRKISETEAILHSLESGPTGYSRAKAASDALVLGFNGAELLTVVLRLPGIYGPRDSNITPGLLEGANTFFTRVQLGDNRPQHEWVYVESAAHAHVLATKALLSTARTPGKRVDGEAFFITDGQPVKFWDFVRKLWAAAGDEYCRTVDKDKLIVIPWWPLVALAILTEVLCFILTLGYKSPGLSRHHLQYMRFGAWWDIGKARERLEYVPLVDTDEGLRRSVAWFKQKTD